MSEALAEVWHASLPRRVVRAVASFSPLGGDRHRTVVRQGGVRAVLGDVTGLEMLPVLLVHRPMPAGAYRIEVGCWQLRVEDARNLARDLLDMADRADCAEGRDG